MGFREGGRRVYASVVLAAFGLQHRVAVVGASPNLTPCLEGSLPGLPGIPSGPVCTSSVVGQES